MPVITPVKFIATTCRHRHETWEWPWTRSIRHRKLENSRNKDTVITYIYNVCKFVWLLFPNVSYLGLFICKDRTMGRSFRMRKKKRTAKRTWVDILNQIIPSHRRAGKKCNKIYLKNHIPLSPSYMSWRLQFC